MVELHCAKTLFGRKECRMSSKRRDNKNRVLRNGESQQKDGRYRFTYYVGEKQKCVYSWKLVETDALPKNKRNCVALRTKEESIRQEIEDGTFFNEKYTLEEYVSKCISISEVRVTKNTIYRKNGYLKNIQKHAISKKNLTDVTIADVKYLMVCLYKEGYKFGTILQLKSLLHSSFSQAMEDDLIQKNPADFKLSSVIPNNTVKKTALTENQMEEYLAFVRNNGFDYYDEINILFNTGLRSSELCGLTFKDIDLENRLLNVNHQVRYEFDKGAFSIVKPKSASGNRIIPLNEEAYKSICNLMRKKRPTIEPIIDGYGKFLVLTDDGKICSSQTWRNRFFAIWRKFEKTVPRDFPKVTAHICRHTYCSILANKNINPKILQYLMGHASINITLNVYTHTQTINVIEELRRLDCI